jgi:aspartyl-tRNA(Asn)/glutamyl-tRNA(Gln) amidotransferase subunit C
MSKLSIEEIQKVAKLARISLTDKELEKMSVEASSILEFVETIQKTKTDGVSTTSQVTGLTDVWREDEVKKSKVAPKDLLAGAPYTHDGYVKVRKVL